MRRESDSTVALGFVLLVVAFWAVVILLAVMFA